ncbi:hypothetical protein QCD79_35045, partial [Pseudomonas quasicaspiana]|nr:hypothetical protein [Pseudomonas quasicaspiana]
HSAKHTPHDRRQPGWPVSETKNNNPETKKAALGGFFCFRIIVFRLADRPAWLPSVVRGVLRGMESTLR